MATQLIIFVLVFTATISLGLAVLFLLGRNRSVIQHRLQDPNLEQIEEAGRSGVYSLNRLAERVGEKVTPSGGSSALRRDMIRAGFRGQSAPLVFIGIKLFFFFFSVAAVSGFLLRLDYPPHIKVFIALAVIAVSFFLPNIIIDVLGRRRKAEVVRHLPDVVDLLEVCVSGGMGMDQAWMSVSDEIRTVCPLLADEMALTNLEIHLGEQRGEAIRHMAQRTGADDLSSLVATLVQSERFGTSIAEALIIFAQNLRELRSMRAQEEAEKMSVKMLFPMVVFIFPVELIIAVGPAALVLMETLGAE